jgi:hypothetical protein
VTIFTVALDYRHIGIWSYIAIIGLLVISSIFNEIGNVFFERDEQQKRRSKGTTKAKKTVNENGPVELPSTQKIQGMCRIASYIFLGVFVSLCFWVASPASDHPLFIATGIGGSFIGQLVPDLDKYIVDGDMRYHRNAITHSGLTVSFIVLIALLTIPDEYVSLDLFFIGLVLGVASHLFADNVESKSTLSQLFVDRARWKECPGDIRGIREDRERAWIDMHGAVMVLTAILLFARFQLASAMSYPIFWDGWELVFVPLVPTSLFLVVFTIVYYILSIVLRIAWSGTTDKPTKRKK